MTCRHLGAAIVCGPPVGVVRRKYLDCPICKTRTRFIIRWMGAYYGSDKTCCRCGDTWQDGYLAGRPFARGWRKKAIAEAKREWAGAMTPQEFKAAIRRDMERAL